jgi:2-methylaconitate cis-trans-isomerase PrpF
MNAKEINFAYRVRHALNENLDQLPAATSNRLAAARQLALSRKKPDAARRVVVPRLATTHGSDGDGFFSRPLSWIGRMSVALPVVIVFAGLVGMYQVEKRQHIVELAEIDAMVLSDELPLTAYLDHGFNAYLAQQGE